MNLGQFQISMDSLYEYFDRKTPKHPTLIQWHKKCEHVPGKAMEWIIGWMTDNMDSPPRNMGKAIVAGWYRYQESNPNKVIRFEETPCEECRGKGLLWYSFIPENQKNRIEGYCICGKCDNWKQYWPSLPAREFVSTKDMLVEHGMKLEGPTKDVPVSSVRIPIKDVVKDIGTSIADMATKPERMWCCDTTPPNHTDECGNNSKNIEKESKWSSC